MKILEKVNNVRFLYFNIKPLVNGWKIDNQNGVKNETA